MKASITKRHGVQGCSCGFAIDLPCEKLYNANVSKKGCVYMPQQYTLHGKCYRYTTLRRVEES